MERQFKVKDFEIKSYYSGSRLANGKQFRYKVIDKVTNQLVESGFSTKATAQKFISNYVKEQNSMIYTVSFFINEMQFIYRAVKIEYSRGYEFAESDEQMMRMYLEDGRTATFNVDTMELLRIERTH